MNISIRRVINRMLYAGQSGLRAHEAGCISAFWAAQADDGRALLEKQWERYDRVQRSPNGMHLAFFDDDADEHCKSWPADLLFPLRSGPRAIARIRLAPPTSKGRRQGRLVCEVFFVSGRFAGLEFDRAPTAGFPKNDFVTVGKWQISDIGQFNEYVEDVENLVDVMKAA